MPRPPCRRCEARARRLAQRRAREEEAGEAGEADDESEYEDCEYEYEDEDEGGGAPGGEPAGVSWSLAAHARNAVEIGLAFGVVCWLLRDWVRKHEEWFVWDPPLEIPHSSLFF